MNWWQRLTGLWGGAGTGRLDVERRFERLRQLTGGTMSQVWEVRDRSDGRRLALKLLDPTATATFEAKFAKLDKPSEGAIALGLKHPRLVETFEHGTTTDGRPYLVMEFLDGTNLHNLAGRPETLAGKRLPLLRQMVEAVGAVHAAGMLHRDLCPHNFLTAPDLASLKLFDFGLALPERPEFMKAGNRTGKPSYMAPELIRRLPIDRRADIFALGASLFEVCVGRPPWESATADQAARRTSLPPPPLSPLCPGIPAPVAAAIERCLAPEPAARFADCGAILKTWKGLAADY